MNSTWNIRSRFGERMVVSLLFTLLISLARDRDNHDPKWGPASPLPVGRAAAR